MEWAGDPGAAALFGSGVRAATLSILSNAPTPPSAYRVAKLIGTTPPAVYRVLSELEQAGEVARVQRPGGGVGWTVRDPDIRAFMRHRVRLVWGGDLYALSAAMTAERQALMNRLSREAHPAPPQGWRPRRRSDSRRDPKKDEILRSWGLIPSLHG